MDNIEKTVEYLKTLIQSLLLIIILMLCVKGYILYYITQLNNVVTEHSTNIHSLQLDGIHYQAAMDNYYQKKIDDNQYKLISGNNEQIKKETKYVHVTD